MIIIRCLDEFLGVINSNIKEQNERKVVKCSANNCQGPDSILTLSTNQQILSIYYSNFLTLCVHNDAILTLCVHNDASLTLSLPCKQCICTCAHEGE